MGRRSVQDRTITPFMYNEEEYRVSPFCCHRYMCPDIIQYARDEDGVECPSAHEFFSRSNTHDLDQDGFQDLYRWDFVHALSWVAHRKSGRHRLDPYQHATFQRGIVRHNIGEEEADPQLEIAMEYAGALGVMVFDEFCHLRDLTEDQVGRNQFTMDVAVDRLDEKDEELEGRADEALERMTMLEGRVGDMEEGYQALLALGRDQVSTGVQACAAIATLTAITTDQQAQLVRAEERMDAMRETILALEHTWDNPIVVDDESDGETVVSDGVELKVRRMRWRFQSHLRADWS